jgi:hypothetical protein
MQSNGTRDIKTGLSGRALLALELVDYVHAEEELVPALPGAVDKRLRSSPGIEQTLQACGHGREQAEQTLQCRPWVIREA